MGTAERQMGEAFEKFSSLLLWGREIGNLPRHFEIFSSPLLWGQNSAACRKIFEIFPMRSEMRFLSLQGARVGKKITAAPKSVSSGTAVKMGAKNHPAVGGRVIQKDIQLKRTAQAFRL